MEEGLFSFPGSSLTGWGQITLSKTTLVVTLAKNGTFKCWNHWNFLNQCVRRFDSLTVMPSFPFLRPIVSFPLQAYCLQFKVTSCSPLAPGVAEKYEWQLSVTLPLSLCIPSVSKLHFHSVYIFFNLLITAALLKHLWDPKHSAAAGAAACRAL